jgi:hypothetical protein
MKYIKLFEAFDRWSRDQKTELQDYCETNLAYLMDEGFKVRVGQNISAHLVDNSGSQMKFNTNPSYHNVSIQIIKKNSLTTDDEREDFEWNDVKDHVIPFILRLERKYDIEKFRLLTEEGTYYIKSDFEKELDELPYHKVSYIDIFLSGEKT